MIIKNKIKNNNNKKDIIKILSKLYKEITFDIIMDDKMAEICDINIELKNGKLTTLTRNDNKVRNYVMKSSNVKQSINGIAKCLQERYIIINDDYNNYLKMKRIIFGTLLENEWTGYDLRNVQHLKYNQRDE